ncbi:MAG: ACT domain-containing protein, partial [Neisseriaceae bacterium]|nr:ACT domain-containing protein [Neisseriaceae bacterium]
IIQNVGENDTTDFSFTVPRNDYQNALKVLNAEQDKIHAKTIDGDDTVVKVSVVGLGMRSHSGVASQIFKTLADENINIQMISTSEIKVSVLIDEKYLELATRALHEVFQLDK